MASILGGAEGEVVIRERWRYVQGRERIVAVRAGLDVCFPFIFGDLADVLKGAEGIQRS